jgi:hypothetical protein
MKIKTAHLIGPTLDWAVASCMGNGIDLDDPDEPWLTVDGLCEKPLHKYTPSTDWSQGGPIIEREGIEIYVRNWSPSPGCRPPGKCEWSARFWYVRQTECKQFGPTPLIAAMRCYVVSRFGYEVEIPEELL